MTPIDLRAPEFDPPDCPSWAKEDPPAVLLPFRGRNGLHRLPGRTFKTEPLATNVRGLDRYHANQFLVYHPDTADFLYDAYTPRTLQYRPGTLPAYEALAAEVTTGCVTETETVRALLEKGATRVRHPYGPPCGPIVGSDRNLDDEALLRSGAGWCNEQARVFIRLCQVCGIPARIVQLFYSDMTTGHCIAECFADGRWCMADCSCFILFPDAGGRLQSAAECHDGGEGQLRCGRTYRRRMRALLALSDAELNFANPADNVRWRTKISRENESDEIRAAKMLHFGIVNYPLPPAPAA